MKCSICIATYGDDVWEKLALERAAPSTNDQGAHEVLIGHEPDGTIASARNNLAARATGDWLLFLDADDQIAPGFLAAMKRALRQERRTRDVPLLLTPAVSYIRNGRRGSSMFHPIGDLRNDNFLVVGTLVEKDLFDKVGGFNDYPHGFEDFALWSKCWRIGAEFVQVQRAVYIAYWNPHSKHKQGWRNRKWQVETHQRVVSELDAWERFWEKVKMGASDECWLWQASKHRDGYGSVGIGNGKTDLAHRVSWRERRGEIPKGMYVLHHCDEPSCVNPDHLFLGTQVDNVRDCTEKGRRNQVRYRKLSSEQREEIKSLYATGDYSLAELGRRFGVTYQSIRHHV